MPILPIALLIAALVGLPTIYYLSKAPQYRDPLGTVVSVEVKPKTKPLAGRRFDYRLLMQVLLSLVLVGASLLIILSQAYDPNSKHWAFGTVGTIVGFWLKGAR